MIWVLAFIFIYVTVAVWDVARINSLYDRIANPGRRKPAVELPPAPRLVINLPAKTEHPRSS
jgi:hypothetical protein